MWLGTQTSEVRCAIASRAALRDIGYLSTGEQSRPPNLLIFTLRAILTSTVCCFFEAKDLASNASQRLVRIVTSETAKAAVYAAFCAIEDTTFKAATAAYQAVALTATYNEAEIDSHNDDIASHTAPLTQENILALQHRGNLQLIALFEAAANTWAFWHDWYLAMWEGRWTDWDLAHEVAQIDNDVWEAGADAVAAEIERIQARRALEVEITALKEQLKQPHVVESAQNRLHNNPPEAIDSKQQLKSEITLIWELLEDAEREIAKPSPSSSALRSIADTLWERSLRIAKYCATLADIALKKSAEVVGETGTKALLLG